MSKRTLNAIERGALRVVANVPIRPSGSLINGHYTGTAYVPWQIIMDLRKEFEAVGVDWKHVHTLVQQEREEARQRLQEKYK